MRISVIIPCYNEAENIVDAVDMIMNGIDDSVSAYEIILVDDGSVDGSQDLIRSILATNGKIRAVFNPENFGKGAALRSGFELAGMDWVLTMDADLQIDIAELKSFLPYCTEYDIITGCRIDRNEGVVRSIVSKIYNFVVSAVIGTAVQDVGCPFKLIKTSIAKNLHLTSNGFVVDAEIFQNARLCNYRIKELPVRCRPRLKGTSSVKVRHFFETFIGVIILRLKKTL